MTCDQRTPAEQIADELAAASELLGGDALPDKAQRLAYTLTENATGGHTETWPAVGPVFDCIVGDAPTPTPVNLGERVEQQAADITIRTRLVTVLQVNDLVAVVGRGTFRVLTKQDTASLRFLNSYGCVSEDI